LPAKTARPERRLERQGQRQAEASLPVSIRAVRKTGSRLEISEA
jgi:hypothetical protein